MKLTSFLELFTSCDKTSKTDNLQQVCEIFNCVAVIANNKKNTDINAVSLFSYGYSSRQAVFIISKFVSNA